MAHQPRHPRRALAHVDQQRAERVPQLVRRDPRQARRVELRQLHHCIQPTRRRPMIERPARPRADHEVLGPREAAAHIGAQADQERTTLVLVALCEEADRAVTPWFLIVAERLAVFAGQFSA